MKRIAAILTAISLGLPVAGLTDEFTRSAAEQSQVTAPSTDRSQPHLIILADMGNEPDEEQQMAHMLVNCNEFELEGLIAVTGKFLNENAEKPFKRVVHPELFHQLIDGYAKVEANLRLQVTDDSDVVCLTDYRRVVIDVEPPADQSQARTEPDTRGSTLRP